MTIYKQHQLPNNSKVKNGKVFITFLGMDSMFAKWKDENGAFKVGNFEGFKKVDDYYEVINKQNEKHNNKHNRE